MEIIRAIQIARREWGNIKSSLEMCGDIGEFDSKNPINSRPTEIEGSRLVENLIDMENKFRTYGYFTQEAAYVFTTLASKEGKRLGFVRDILFETKSGELINIVVRDSTPYTKNLNLERTSSNDLLIPYSSIIAIGDFIIVSEEDLI